MNIQEYIASGILEEYVLGTASPQEKREVECLASIYPELRQELTDLEEALEQYAFSLQRTPPPALKERILAEITRQEPTTDVQTKTEVQTETVPVAPEAESAPVIPMWNESSRPTYGWSWVVAASLGLIVIFFSFYLFNQLRDSQQTVSLLRDSNLNLEADLRKMRERQSRSEQAMALLRQPGTQVISLAAVGQRQQSPVTLYWNKESGIVHLEVDSLVRPPEYMQYQLWCIQDGKPVDAGVFEIEDNQYLVRAQKTFQKAEAFAITVERRGGSPTPTLDAMVVMGKLGS